jgi:predicted Zn-dependent peptidase
MEYNKIVLDNGLTIVHEKRDVPVTTVMLSVKYGSAFEGEKDKGIAHFIEHMCFKGTQKRNVNDIAMEVEGVGGDLNAFTSEEITAYHVKLPSEHLKLAMDVLFDVFFNASFPEDTFEKEANVIIEEIKMYKDNPRAHVLDEIKCSLYEKPFGMFIGGTEENVKSFTREKILNKHRDIYVPKNTILSVVGNNEFEEVITLAKEFCPERNGKFLELEKIQEREEKRGELRKGINQTNLAIGFHFPKSNEKERFAAEIFSNILGEGMSSRLFMEVREKRGLVYNIKTDIDSGNQYGYFLIWAGTDPTKKDEVIKLILEEFHKMKDISEEELERAKIKIVGERKIKSEESDFTALNLIVEEVSGDYKNYYKYEEEIKKVRVDDIKKISENTSYALFVLNPTE